MPSEYVCVAGRLTDAYHPYMPHVDREVLFRRNRMSVEMAYSIDEMLKEEDIDQELLLEDAAFVFRSMLLFPDYRLGSPTLA